MVPAGAVAAAYRVELFAQRPSMIPHPQCQARAPHGRWRGMAVAALLLLAGCANGDFGEVKPSLVRADIHDWIGLDAIAGRPTWPSHFELTDDERQLRDLAYPLIEPAYDRKRWYSMAGEYGVIGASHRTVFDRTAYATQLLSPRYSSPSARYAQLIDDIRNDITRIDPFFANARGVLDTDGKRRQALAFVQPSHLERKNANRRIQENALIVAWVHSSLNRRVASYRFALERLVVITPSAMAVDAERGLNELQARIAEHRRVVPGRGVRTASAR